MGEAYEEMAVMRGETELERLLCCANERDFAIEKLEAENATRKKQLEDKDEIIKAKVDEIYEQTAVIVVLEGKIKELEAENAELKYGIERFGWLLKRVLNHIEKTAIICAEIGTALRQIRWCDCYDKLHEVIK
jgi:chromosome segregation ATPase